MSAAQDAANYAQRPTSPSPSVASEKTEAELQVRECIVFFFVSYRGHFFACRIFVQMIEKYIHSKSDSKCDIK